MVKAKKPVHLYNYRLYCLLKQELTRSNSYFNRVGTLQGNIQITLAESKA